MNGDELDRLASAWCDGSLTAEEHARLEALVAADVEKCDRLLRILAVHGQLSWDLAAQPQGRHLAACSPPPGTRTQARPGRWFTRGLLGVAALAAAVLLFLGLGWHSPPAEERPPLARVVRASAVEWSNGCPPRQANDPLFAADRLALDSGVLEVGFPSGTRVVLHGPTIFEVLGPDRLRLRAGTLIARLPPGSPGLEIEGPGVRVVDRGTAFGMRVDDAGVSEIHVFEGAVESTVTGLAAAPPQRIEANQAVRINPLAGQITDIPVNADSFRQDDQPITLVDWVGARSPEAKTPVPLSRSTAAFEPTGPAEAALWRRAFSLREPLHRFATGPAVHGGAEFWSLAGKGQNPWTGFGGRESRDAFWLMLGSNHEHWRAYGAWLFLRDDFAPGAVGPLAFDATGQLSVNIAFNKGQHFAVRFLVKAGDAYYLSRTATQRAEPLVLTGPQLTGELWARYNLTTDLRANGGQSGDGHVASNLTHGAGALPYDVPTAALRDIQGVGVYAESVDRNATQYRAIGWNEFKAAAVRQDTQ